MWEEVAAAGVGSRRSIRYYTRRNDLSNILARMLGHSKKRLGAKNNDARMESASDFSLRK